MLSTFTYYEKPIYLCIPSISIDNCNSLSHAAFLPAVIPGVQPVEFEWMISSFGDGAAEVVGTVSPESDLILTQVWRSLGLLGPLDKRQLLSQSCWCLFVIPPVYATQSP